MKMARTVFALLTVTALESARADDAKGEGKLQPARPSSADRSQAAPPSSADSSQAAAPSSADTPMPAVALAAQEPERAAQLSQLERELAAVMDELVAARVRAGVIARGLFHTELSVEVVRRADDQRLAHLKLALDGVPVHDSDGTALGRDRAKLFSGYVAPGMHELTIELTEDARQGASFGYTRSERYRIELKKGRSTQVELVLRDDSDMAEQAAEGDHGEYQIETTVRVSSSETKASETKASVSKARR